MANDLLGTTEIAEMFGVSRQRVHQLSREYPDFPEPAIKRTRAMFWKRAQITRWGIKHGYLEGGTQ